MRRLVKKHPEIKGIISSGSSGAVIVGGVLSALPDIPLNYTHVHKGDSHNGTISGRFADGSYIFVDD